MRGVGGGVHLSRTVENLFERSEGRKEGRRRELVKLTQSHWRRCETHAGASLVAADADVVDRIALGQKPCRLRRQIYSITGFLLFACAASSLVSF